MEDNRCAPGVVVIFNNLRLILRPTIKDRPAGISLLDHIDLGIMHTVWQQIDDSEILVLLDLRFKKVALQAESIAICHVTTMDPCRIRKTESQSSISDCDFEWRRKDTGE